MTNEELMSMYRDVVKKNHYDPYGESYLDEYVDIGMHKLEEMLEQEIKTRLNKES